MPRTMLIAVSASCGLTSPIRYTVLLSVTTLIREPSTFSLVSSSALTLVVSHVSFVLASAEETPESLISL